MKLFYASGLCSLADHIALEWSGQPYETREVNIHGEKTPELLEVNPAGMIPVLQDGDWIVTQNMAILNYIADSYPSAGLGGDGTARSRAQVNQWLAFSNADIHPICEILFRKSAHLSDEKARQEDAQAARQAIHDKLKLADRQLAQQDWLTDQRSIADTYLYVIMRWCSLLNVDISDLTNLTAFTQRMEADDGVKQVLNQEGLEPIAAS